MIYRKLSIIAAMAATSVAVHAQTTGGYGATSPRTPTINQTNTPYTLGSFPNNGASATGTITTLSYQANYNSAGTQGTTIARLCFNQGATTYCNSWGVLLRQSISDFAGLPANTVFFLQVGVSKSGGSVVLLSPPVTPSGQSSITVNYNL